MPALAGSRHKASQRSRDWRTRYPGRPPHVTSQQQCLLLVPRHGRSRRRPQRPHRARSAALHPPPARRVPEPPVRRSRRGPRPRAGSTAAQGGRGAEGAPARARASRERAPGDRSQGPVVAARPRSPDPRRRGPGTVDRRFPHAVGPDRHLPGGLHRTPRPRHRPQRRDAGADAAAVRPRIGFPEVGNRHRPGFRRAQPVRLRSRRRARLQGHRGRLRRARATGQSHAGRRRRLGPQRSAADAGRPTVSERHGGPAGAVDAGGTPAVGAVRVRGRDGQRRPDRAAGLEGRRRLGLAAPVAAAGAAGSSVVGGAGTRHTGFQRPAAWPAGHRQDGLRAPDHRADRWQRLCHRLPRRPGRRGRTVGPPGQPAAEPVLRGAAPAHGPSAGRGRRHLPERLQQPARPRLRQVHREQGLGQQPAGDPTRAR